MIRNWNQLTQKSLNKGKGTVGTQKPKNGKYRLKDIGGLIKGRKQFIAIIIRKKERNAQIVIIARKNGKRALKNI